jgi:DNA-binding NtrC family response regulator
VQKNVLKLHPPSHKRYKNGPPSFWNVKCVSSISDDMTFCFGSAASMKELERRIGLIARSGEPVLIEGESGSGKQTLAEHLHEVRAKGGQFVRILCGSTFHGLQAAAGNTIFLKHIQLLPVDRQGTVLLALEQTRGEVPWIVSSASDALKQLVARGEFLPELFYRLSAYRVSIPPLRERRQDIAELFVLMLGRMEAEMGLTAVPPPATAMDVLAEYSWPGNIRELQSIVRSYLIAPNPADLIAEITRRRGAIRSDIPDEGKQLALREQVRQASRRLESEIILRSLERHRWNRRRAAETLQISYRSLLYKLKNCSIRENGQSRPKAGSE